MAGDGVSQRDSPTKKMVPGYPTFFDRLFEVTLMMMMMMVVMMMMMMMIVAKFKKLT